MKDVKAIVAKNLTSLRKINGLTQAELAEKLNYSDKAVSRWEHGETMPDINVLYELCEFYGITMNDLVNEEYTADAKENGKEKSENAYRMWLGIVTASTVWLFFTILFIYTRMVRESAYWLSFVWAIPASILPFMYLCRKNFGWIVRFVLGSVVIWTLISAVYLHLLVGFGANLWMIFLIGIPLQAMYFMLQKMKKYKQYL